MVKKLTGWGIKGKPFSREQFKNTFIKGSHKMSYKQYLIDISPKNYRTPRQKLGLKTAMR